MSRDMERRPYESQSRRGEPQRGEYRSHGGHPTILYVRNISDRVRYEDLKHLFQKYGKLVDVTIPLDYHSGLPKGYCFIEFEDPRDAEEAHYRMARQRLFGREIEIEFARGNRKTAGEMRNRDGRGNGMPPQYGRGGGVGGRDGYRGGGDYRPRAEYRGDSRGDYHRGDDRRERKRERSRSRSNSRGNSGYRNAGAEHKKPVASYSRSRSRSRSAGSRNRSGSNVNESPVFNSRKHERSRSPQDRSRSRSRSRPISSPNRDMGSRSP